MATKPKLTVNELMDSILAVDDDMTEEEAKAELKAAGFDIKKTEASLNNRFEQLRALAKRRKLDEARAAREKQPSFDFVAKVKAMGMRAARTREGYSFLVIGDAMQCPFCWRSLTPKEAEAPKGRMECRDCGVETDYREAPPWQPPAPTETEALLHKATAAALRRRAGGGP